MAFFTYGQNNSGGGFDYDAKGGITDYVIIEADDYQDANYRAERIGLYFDGEGDCSCCGERWYEQWNDNGAYAEPSIYGDPIDSVKLRTYWMTNGEFNAFVHYKDGRITGHLPGPKR